MRSAVHRHAMWAVVLLLSAVGCSANDDLPAPRIASVTPDRGPPGASAAISGDDFCHQLENEDPLVCVQQGTVHFATAVADVTMYADSVITADVPSLAGKVRITVEVAGVVSNGVDFTIE